MNLQLHGKHALVSGSSGGIGATIAQTLAKEGAIVAVHGRDEERTQTRALNSHHNSHLEACCRSRANVSMEGRLFAPKVLHSGQNTNSAKERGSSLPVIGLLDSAQDEDEDRW